LVRDNDHKWLIVRNPPHSQAGEPDNLIDSMMRAQDRKGYVTVFLHGRFEVCPIPPDDGTPPAQDPDSYVCIASARQLKVAK